MQCEVQPSRQLVWTWSQAARFHRIEALGGQRPSLVLCVPESVAIGRPFPRQASPEDRDAALANRRGCIRPSLIRQGLVAHCAERGGRLSRRCQGRCGRPGNDDDTGDEHDFEHDRPHGLPKARPWAGKVYSTFAGVPSAGTPRRWSERAALTPDVSRPVGTIPCSVRRNSLFAGEKFPVPVEQGICLQPRCFAWRIRDDKRRRSPDS